MNTPDTPVQSLITLVITSIIAVILAFVILICFVGPAEFGIDPTGLGKKMGLTVLAEASPQSAKIAINCPSGKQAHDWSDIVIITIPANSGLEYKFHVKKDNELAYAWKTNGEKLYFDFHGEPQGDTTGYFKSFKETTDSQSNGALTAPFTGSHGWYWENKTSTPVQVTLKTKGQYQIKGLIL